MTPKQLATKILQYRNSSSLIVPGILHAELGPDAMKEALARRWVEADLDTGYLRLSSQYTTLDQMRQLVEAKCDNCKCEPCECCENCGKHPCVCKKEESKGTRSFMDAHIIRSQQEAFVGTPAYGSGQPAQPPAPRVAPQVDANRSQEPMVGEDVIIADEGRSYPAKIASKNPDGTFKLSFGPNKPLRQDRMFRKEEIQRVKPGDVQLVK